MNGAQVFFYGVAYGQFLAGAVSSGGSGGGDDSNRPWRPPKSSHEADAAPPVLQRKKRSSSASHKKQVKDPAAPAPEGEGQAGPYPCPICHRLFGAVKAVHGHQRSHPERDWRGMAPPRPPPPVAADGRQYRYACDRCGAPFETRQALGGHRASHSGKMGCFWLSRQPAAPAVEPAAAPAPASIPVFPFDLNEPAVPEEEE
ncbi:hypothetical protein BAE44_0011148 [Dichanthelium oligosanthes]|uniref:C2H2-type domain-containing protein n=1 Tax=Dichanthelium oligosanthes TaxID=888268 RepID=A0A1E5VRT2_9POAL|nr:hypothetical protein BAE44_0011148 [Dichanthelium oligosanthes]